MSFALTVPIFKGNTHTAPYIVHLEKGQLEAEAEEEVSTAEKLAGKKARARRMATVKASKKNERLQVARITPKAKPKKEKMQKPHWPAKPRMEKRSPRQRAQAPVVAKRMSSTEKRHRSKPETKEEQKDVKPIEPHKKEAEQPAKKSVEPAKKSVEPAKKEVEPAKKEAEPAKKSVESVKNDVNLRDAARHEVAVPLPPKPEEETYVGKSHEKPGWQEISPEAKSKEETKEKEAIFKKMRTLDDDDELLIGEKIAPIMQEKPVEKIMYGVVPKIELASVDGAKIEITVHANPADQLCENCELVSMLYENQAEQILLDVDQEDPSPPEFKKIRAGTLSEYSPVDGLCKGCSLFSFFRVNPLEELIYELLNEEKIIAVAHIEKKPIGSVSILEELCRGCDILSMIADNLTAEVFTEQMPDEAFAGIVNEVSEDPVSVETGETQQETVSEPMVIEVPEAEFKVAKLKSETEHHEIAVIRGRDSSESRVADIQTPGENRTPTKEEYKKVLEIEVAREPEKSEVLVASEAEIGLPIYVRKDIEIKVFFSGKETGTSFRLVKKTHPMGDEKYFETDITETLDEIGLAGESGLRKMFSLLRAGEGTYRFIIESSNAKINGINLEIILHKGLKSEKLKKYNGIEIVPGTVVEFSFLLPEAVFWDDDDYFTGTIEDSRFTTKFNDETGLIWKEKTSR